MFTTVSFLSALVAMAGSVIEWGKKLHEGTDPSRINAEIQVVLEHARRQPKAEFYKYRINKIHELAKLNDKESTLDKLFEKYLKLNLKLEHYLISWTDRPIIRLLRTAGVILSLYILGIIILIGGFYTIVAIFNPEIEGIEEIPFDFMAWIVMIISIVSVIGFILLLVFGNRISGRNVVANNFHEIMELSGEDLKTTELDSVEKYKHYLNQFTSNISINQQ